MRRGSPLQVEPLETRETPARFGTPWPDGQHVTLSLAPDGTSIAGRTSNLASFLNQLGPQAKQDALSAFQTWAVQANINVGLVHDDGSAFGTPGEVQNDPRFGDIRIGGAALPKDVLAVTAPFNYYDNYSGNVVVNTSSNYGGPNGVDLFTALLQESGHAFGIGNSPDITSVMYEYYSGIRTGLSAADVAAIRNLYGARTPDKYEGSAGNNTLGSATLYTDIVTADLSSTDDVDVYKITTGLLTSRLTVNLQASGLSLLTARVELLDSSGRVLTTAAATDPTANDLVVTFDNPRMLSTYYVRVSSARSDVFGVGSYGLEIAQGSIVTSLLGSVNSLLQETGLNDTIYTATTLLSSTLSVSSQTEYGGSGGFGSHSDVDYYRITVPPSLDGNAVNLVTTVWGINGASLNPWISVEDGLGDSSPGQVIAADGTTTTIQVPGLLPGRTYFVRISSDTQSIGAYHFAGDLRSDSLAVPLAATGSVSPSHASVSNVLYIAQSGQVHFVLSASGGAVELIVTSKTGTIVADITAQGGRGRSVDVFLPVGEYRVMMRSASSLAAAYSLGIALITDPVGPQASDPTRTPDSSPPPPSDGGGTSTGTDPAPTSPPPVSPPPPTSDPGNSWWWTSTQPGDDATWY